MALAPVPVPAMARPTAVVFAPQAAPAPTAGPSGPEQRYADALLRAQTKHAALNPASNWYRRELLEWVMDRKSEYIAAGATPDVALQRAVALMEGN